MTWGRMMTELVPPDEIYVPFQEAIDNYMIADLGVFTGEVKYLRATPKRKAADAMYELLRFDVLGYFEGEWDSVNRHPASRFGDWVKIIKATIALADGNGGE